MTNPEHEAASAFHMSHSATDQPDLLAAVVAGTKRIVEVREAREPRSDLERRAHATPRRPVGRFHAAVCAADRVNIIAECKRRSPSRGVLRSSYDPALIASAYAAAGAAAISVLTEPTFFDGSLDHLAAVRSAVELPVLRKDFIVSEYQLLEALAAGADAVLLIAAALRPVELKVLHDHAVRLGLDALVEVHDATELSIAIDAGARLVGVNNRNLRTFEVELHVSEELMAQMPPDVGAVSESGIASSDDVRRLRQSGYKAFLIGERFMLADDPGRELQSLLQGCAVESGATVTRLKAVNNARTNVP